MRTIGNARTELSKPFIARGCARIRRPAAAEVTVNAPSRGWLRLALNIKNSEAEQLARELAKQTGEGVTEAIRKAV